MANPVAIADRATPDCSTIFSGYLAANASGAFKSFALNSKGQVAYIGDAKNPMKVEFQECQSLEVGEPHDTQKSGRIYVPSKNKCIAITNQQNAVGPYYTSLDTCNTEYPQRWVLNTANNNAIYWSGDSDEEGTILQGGCGLLGYKSHNRGVPVITHSNNQITVECKGTPFRLAKAPH
ncbi:hypothetical protein PILCRDRAFT_818024 [Piloderma croceum F 1598]|uniref:Ricin B lectin domain-containing protein n=1 Tax=Piloderma croceum (strain F 1598) TaxID=765440 RepID=A0A0C3FJ55_PILCF|nr:hypothetical protein PILCRDRAFT_818024 [Piloderma croceum F 1598]